MNIGTTASVRVRKNILELDRREFQLLNDGFEALVAAEGARGYQYIAGLYGKPGPSRRPADPLLFLPWHRAYLIAFEQALGRFSLGLPLAYWAWTDESALPSGIPGRLNAIAYTDKDRGIWLNQFCRAPIAFIGEEHYTHRAQGRERDLLEPVRKAREAAALPRSVDFSAALEEASRDLRLWVGGDLSDDDVAAYDPIFWFHHANVDRLWTEWLRAHPGVAFPESVLDRELEPFGVTVRSVLTAEPAVYTYDALP